MAGSAESAERAQQNGHVAKLPVLSTQGGICGYWQISYVWRAFELTRPSLGGMGAALIPDRQATAS